MFVKQHSRLVEVPLLEPFRVGIDNSIQQFNSLHIDTEFGIAGIGVDSNFDRIELPYP